MKDETKYLSAYLELARAELSRAVIVKHADTVTSGGPDVSITANKRTLWLEFKQGPRIKWANALQQLTCRRIAAVGYCWIVLYEEINGVKRTCILTPDEILVEAVPGFDHRFVLDFTRKVLYAAA